MSGPDPQPSHEATGIARHGRLPRRGAWGTVGKLIASIAAVVVASAVGLGAYAVYDLTSGAHGSVHLIGQPDQPIPDIGALKGGVNILILASDSRTGEGDGWGSTDDSAGLGNNDVTMLLHLSHDHTNATVVSFPRDLMIPIPSCPTEGGGTSYAQDKGQLNSTLATGGLPCTVLTIQKLTGITSIPFAGVIKFNGVVAMSNAIGGVPVCIGGGGIHDPKTSLDLDPGTRWLKGKQATEFLRTRHGVGDGSDLGRISNQMVFLSSLVRQIKTAGTLTNPAKLWGLAKAAVDNMVWSDRVTATTMYQIATALKGLKLSNVSFVQYPVLADPDDAAHVIPNQTAADALFDAIVRDRPIAITGGTGDGDQASIVETPTPAPTGGAPDAGTSTPKPGSTSGHSASGGSASGGSAQLPDSIHGQTAATKSCANGAG